MEFLDYGGLVAFKEELSNIFITKDPYRDTSVLKPTNFQQKFNDNQIYFKFDYGNEDQKIDLFINRDNDLNNSHTGVKAYHFMDGLSCPTDGLVGDYADIVAKNITLKNGNSIVTIDANGDGLSLDTTKYYTKEEVDDLIQNEGGGSSITVDSTITQGGTNPVEGGAIYTGLDSKADKSDTYTKTEVDSILSDVQGQLTFDNVPTENSTNPVTSGGVYDAIQYSNKTIDFNKLMIDFPQRIPEDMKLINENAVIYRAGRIYYKINEGAAAGVLTQVKYNTHAVLVSKTPEACITYSSYNPNVITSPHQIIYGDGDIYYYSATVYGWDGANFDPDETNVRVVRRRFESDEEVARYILSQIPLTPEKTLSDFYITDAYTKAEVDAAINDKYELITNAEIDTIVAGT